MLDTTPLPKKNAAVFLKDIIRLSPNKKLVYELMPNLFVRFMGGKVTTDTNGFRITPGSCAQSDSYTIAGIGDSVMFGWRVHDQETYLSYLAETLPDTCIQILNMAVPGYNTTMEVEALAEKGMQFHPDLVVIHFVDNDLYLPNFIQQKDNHVTLTRSYLLAALSRWQGTRIRTAPFDRLIRNGGEVPEEYKFMVGTDAYRRAMDRLEKMSREHNFKILLLSNWSTPDFVQDMSTELGIPLLELGAPLKEYCQKNELQESVLFISENDPHYSPLAHRIIADEIHSFLDNNPSFLKP